MFPAEETIMATGVGWFEIGATDYDGLKSFYGELFGWKLNDVSNDGMKYAMFEGDGDAIGGGLYEGEAKGPLVYIAVNDVDASLAQITGKGGEVVTPKTVVPGMVTFAQFKDPFGNVIGLYETAMPE